MFPFLTHKVSPVSSHSWTQASSLLSNAFNALLNWFASIFIWDFFPFIVIQKFLIFKSKLGETGGGGMPMCVVLHLRCFLWRLAAPWLSKCLKS